MAKKIDEEVMEQITRNAASLYLAAEVLQQQEYTEKERDAVKDVYLMANEYFCTLCENYGIDPMCFSGIGKHPAIN